MAPAVIGTMTPIWVGAAAGSGTIIALVEVTLRPDPSYCAASG